MTAERLRALRWPRPAVCTARDPRAGTARSWSTDASHAVGTIPVSQIRKAGLYGITFFLLENGIGQDLKVTELPVR